jgi:hypothetical protein
MTLAAHRPRSYKQSNKGTMHRNGNRLFDEVARTENLNVRGCILMLTEHDINTRTGVNLNHSLSHTTSVKTR